MGSPFTQPHCYGTNDLSPYPQRVSAKSPFCGICFVLVHKPQYVPKHEYFGGPEHPK